MFLLNLLDDLKLDVQDAVIEHNIKKNINNYNKAVFKSNIAKVANMDLSDKIGEACRVANEIATSNNPDDTLEEYSNYLHLLLTDDEMHDFVQKLINTASRDRNSCIALLNILFDEEISVVICDSFFYNEVLITAFGFTIPEDAFIIPDLVPNLDDYTLNCTDDVINDILEMEQRFEDDESPAEDPSEPEPEIISESSTNEEIKPEPVVCDVIDNTVAEEEPVKDVDVKVVEPEQPKLAEPEFVKNDVKEDTPKKDMSSKTTHVETYGMIMDDMTDIANKVLDKVTGDMAAAPEPPKTTRRPTTKKKR